MSTCKKLWAKENGVQYSNDNWLKDIVEAQVKAFRPDVMFLDDLYVTDSSFDSFYERFRLLRVKMIGWRASPTEDYSILRDLDLMLTCASYFAKQMQDHGVNARLMLHGFEPAILKLIGARYRTDIGFYFHGQSRSRGGFS